MANKANERGLIGKLRWPIREFNFEFKLEKKTMHNGL